MYPEEGETPLYAPTNPACGTTLDHLPGRPRINEDSAIAVHSSLAVLLSLIVPALTIFGHGIYVLLRYALP